MCMFYFVLFCDLLYVIYFRSLVHSVCMMYVWSLYFAAAYSCVDRILVIASMDEM